MRHLLTFALTLGLPIAASAQIINGVATVIDGDSLSFTGSEIRLFGIDAPEGAQTCKRDGVTWPCGRDAVTHLRELVDGKQLECESRDTDRYGRMVAVCHADRIDLARAMIDAGFAVPLPQFSDAYVDSAARARGLRLGIWNSEFQMPADYRAAHSASAKPMQRVVTAPAQARPAAERLWSGGCVIKGNRNRKGQWIYHLPGMPYYNATRPEEIFCTEAQAVAAGYRRAIVR